MKWAKTRRADLRGCSNRAGSDITCRCLFLLLFLLRNPGVILPRSLGKTDDGDQRVRLEQISGDDVARKVRKMRAVEAVSNAVFDAVADAVADAAAVAVLLAVFDGGVVGIVRLEEIVPLVEVLDDFRR